MDVKIIKNSRNEDTIEVTHDGATASVPFGRSAGKHEMPKLDAKIASDNVKILWDKIKDLSVDKAESILRDNIKEMGANTTLALSYILYKLNNPAISQNVFPYPLGNVAGGWDKKQIQEYLVIPVTAKSIKEAVEMNRDVWKQVGEKIGVKKNDENGWVSDKDDMKTLDTVTAIAESMGCRVGLDMAASELFNGKEYVYDTMGKKYTPDEQFSFVYDLIDVYNLIYLEDPFHEDDFESFSDITAEFSNKCIITGDDLYTTNPDRFKKGLEMNASNGILIKPDQIGTLSFAKHVIEVAHKNNVITTMSHRSGDTQENILSDLALRWGCQLVKFGVMGPERESKLNRLVELWDKVDDPKMVRLGF